MEPTDGAEDSTEPSVFALLQSKREPVAAAASKGKFAPKVKARPGARPAAAAAAAATAAVKVKTEPNVLKEEPVKVEEVPLVKVKEEPRDDGRGKTKLEPEVLIEEEKKVEPIKVEPHKEEPHKEEPHKEEVNGSINEPMELDEPVQLDVPMLDEPVLKEPVVSTPGVDRVVREIDVFLTPHVDPETNVRTLQMLSFSVISHLLCKFGVLRLMVLEVIAVVRSAISIATILETIQLGGTVSRGLQLLTSSISRLDC